MNLSLKYLCPLISISFTYQFKPSLKVCVSHCHLNKSCLQFGSDVLFPLLANSHAKLQDCRCIGTWYAHTIYYGSLIWYGFFVSCNPYYFHSVNKSSNLLAIKQKTWESRDRRTGRQKNKNHIWEATRHRGALGTDVNVWAWSCKFASCSRILIFFYLPTLFLIHR